MRQMQSLSILNDVYTKEPLMARLHLMGRAFICPFHKIVGYFPEAGDILDIGCGHGSFAQLLYHDVSNKNRRVTGQDHDIRKIEMAKKHENASLMFVSKRLEELPSSAYDAIAIMDVLCIIDMGNWGEVLRDCFRLLRPGGRLVVKEVIDKPGWRYWMTMTEEVLATCILKISKGTVPHFESIKTYCDKFKEAGFLIADVYKMPKWYYSHCLFVALKPEAESVDGLKR